MADNAFKEGKSCIDLRFDFSRELVVDLLSLTVLRYDWYWAKNVVEGSIDVCN